MSLIDQKMRKVLSSFDVIFFYVLPDFNQNSWGGFVCLFSFFSNTQKRNIYFILQNNNVLENTEEA